MAEDISGDDLAVTFPDPADAPAPSSGPTATPTDWSRARFPEGERGRPHPQLYRHGAAAALHGWDLHRYHTGAELQLGEADYDAALLAVDPKDGVIAPHEGALSPVLKEMIAMQEDR